MGWLRNAANDGPGRIHGIIGRVLPQVQLSYPITYTRLAAGGTFDPTDPTAQTTTATEYAVEGFVDEDMELYRQRGVLTLGERVVVLTQKSALDAGLTLQSGTVEAESDKVAARGTTSVVKEVGQDSAQALWFLGVTP